MLQQLLWEYKDVLWNLSRDWRQYYHIWPIPKPNGKKRWIHAPQGRLKELQRELVSYLLTFPLHEAAKAYQPGKGGHEQVALAHATFGEGKSWWFEGDISDFFGHVTGKMLARHGIPKQVIRAITVLHPRRGWVLPQGAPTSPPASNLVMYDFDTELKSILPEDSLYTRYADNIGVSLLTPMSRRTIIITVAELLEKYHFYLNPEKIRYVPPGHGQIYLGINIDNGELTLPAKYKVRKLRSKIHHFKMGDTSEESKDGMLNYLKKISPQQYAREKRRLKIQ